MPDDSTSVSEPTADDCCACCEEPARACTCITCPACEAKTADELCENCGDCEDCCACEACTRIRCRRRVEQVCTRCASCDECCECAHCSACGDPCEYTCDTCEQCSQCCECYVCVRCEERFSEPTCPDCERCEGCCACQEGPIYPYDTDPLEHLAFQGTPAGGVFLGVELETNVQRSLTAKAEAWREACEGFAILKADSSIGHGFEIVTAPCSLEIQQHEWSRLLRDAALTTDLTSWNSADACCGMHVHVSRAPISPLTLGKIIVFMNAPETEAPLTALAGRTSERWAKRSPKKVTDTLVTCAHCGGRTKGRREGRCISCRRRTPAARDSQSRYQAVNLCNADTIEFRIFRGTLKLDHVLANLEFCDAVVRWAMQASIRDCADWSAFWAYVRQHQKTYGHLMTYMATKGY